MRFYHTFFLPLTFLACAIPGFSDSAWTYGVSETEGWYDYNKSYDGDINMCWAASASDLICWWQDNSAYKRYASTDTPSGSAVWDTFRTSFNDKAGSPFFAYEWYFLGTYEPFTYSSSYGSSWSMPTDTKNIGGGYYSNAGLSLSDISNYADTTDGSSYSSYYYYFSSFIVDALNNGYALSLGVVNLGGTSSARGSNNHAITMWGCDYTTDANGNIAITTLYITDSDDRSSDTLQTVSCYGAPLADGENDQFCLSTAYYNKLTPEYIGDYYITDITALNLLESIPEPSSVVLVLAGLPFVLRRKRR